MGVYFLVYNRCQILGGIDPNKEYPMTDYNAFLVKLVSGGISGSFTWFISYPFDIVKTYI